MKLTAKPHSRSEKRGIPRRRLLLFLAGVLAAVVIGGFTFARELLRVEAGPRQAEVIVVLGGESVDRVRQALELFRHGAARRIIVSGAGDSDFIRQQLMHSGVPEAVIELEDRSRNTKENAEFTARLLKKNGVQQAIIVTSWFHSRRALNSFRRFAPQVRFSSLPAEHYEALSVEATHVFQEYVKTVWYSVRYRILPWSASTA